MDIIDLTFLPFYLSGLTGRADIDSEVEKYKHIDSNDENEIKKIITGRLKPIVEMYPEKFHIKMKEALSYALTVNDIDLETLYDVYLLPFPPPDNVKLFFIWLWEVLYDGQPYLLSNVEKITVIESNINDVNVFLHSLYSE